MSALFFWPFFLWSPFHGLFGVFLIVVVCLLLFGRHPYHYGYPAPPAGPSRSDALAILEGRYARGEIQREEYLQKKQDLGG